MAGPRSWQSGMALIGVLLFLLILTGIGVVVVALVGRNTEQQAAQSKSVVGFYAAEAGLNVAAARVRNTLLGFNVPTNCSARMIAVGNRSVTYSLSGCGQVPQTITVPAGEPFEGLNAIRYVYDVTSVAANPAGFDEAILQMRFETRLIPMFQLVAFYKEDLELTVGPPMVIDGRMHSNADLYLNTESCSPGAQILGQVTVVNGLFRGRKDDLTYGNSGVVGIRKPDGTLKILGRTYPPEDDSSCSAITTRTVSPAETSLWGGRVRLGLRNVTLPGQDDLLCSPWSCPPGQDPGSYWTRGDLRIVLDTTTTERLNESGSPAGPLLYPVRVYAADGTVDGARTNALKNFMRAVPGGITYSDVPRSTAAECLPTQASNACETVAYGRWDQYEPAFPRTSGGCPQNRDPRVPITSGNYCYDYRYGGFFNWRERKPILVVNVHWEALERWNATNGAPLFDPADTSDGGLVVYVTVRADGSGYAGSSPIANNYGVRVHAQTLRQGPSQKGVTFASDQAAYVLGNFNCTTPNASGGDTQPATCGSGGKFPAAVAGDTMNVLSQAWVESYDPDGGGPAPTLARPRDERSTQTPRPSNRPPAAQTFVNAAFLAGNDSTTCPGNPGGRDCQRDYYSGGLENYPRFHETWSGQRFWYRGSFVAIDTPKHTCYVRNSGLTATEINRGTTSGSSLSVTCQSYLLNGAQLQGYWRMQETYSYSPPPRRWFYEVDFDDAANLPPLAPRFITLRQEYFTEQFR